MSAPENLSMTYVHLMLASDGIGPREAARQAGFACGVPSEKARRLLEKATLAREISLDREDIENEIAAIEAKIAALRQELIQKREWLAVCDEV